MNDPLFFLATSARTQILTSQPGVKRDIHSPEIHCGMAARSFISRNHRWLLLRILRTPFRGVSHFLALYPLSLSAHTIAFHSRRSLHLRIMLLSYSRLVTPIMLINSALYDPCVNTSISLCHHESKFKPSDLHLVYIVTTNWKLTVLKNGVCVRGNACLGLLCIEGESHNRGLDSAKPARTRKVGRILSRCMNAAASCCSTS
jgi:hypothetical protein